MSIMWSAPQKDLLWIKIFLTSRKPPIRSSRFESVCRVDFLHYLGIIFWGDGNNQKVFF